MSPVSLFHLLFLFPSAFLFFVFQEPGPVLLPSPGPPGLVQEPGQRQEGKGAESPGPPLGERPRRRLLLLRALLQRPRVRGGVRTARLKRGQRLPIRQGEVENERNKGFAPCRPAAATVLGCHTVAAATVLADA